MIAGVYKLIRTYFMEKNVKVIIIIIKMLKESSLLFCMRKKKRMEKDEGGPYIGCPCHIFEFT